MQFVAELEDYKPRIWRKFQIKSNTNLTDFCYMLMEMFRMEGSHLFEFNINQDRYALPGQDDWGAVESKNVSGILINKLFVREGDAGNLWYDFGDNWRIIVKLEKLNITNPISKKLPCVISGEGYGIVEDCGGIWGLQEIAEGLKTGKGEDWENRKSWLEEMTHDVLEVGTDYFDADELTELMHDSDLAEIYDD